MMERTHCSLDREIIGFFPPRNAGPQGKLLALRSDSKKPSQTLVSMPTRLRPSLLACWPGSGRGLFGSHWLLILLAGAWKVQGVLLACLNPTTNSTSLGLQLIFEIQRDSLHSHVQAMYLAAFSPLCTHICTFPEVSLFLLTVPPRLCVQQVLSESQENTQTFGKAN